MDLLGRSFELLASVTTLMYLARVAGHYRQRLDLWRRAQSLQCYYL
jgi:hypothetical protein